MDSSRILRDLHSLGGGNQQSWVRLLGALTVNGIRHAGIWERIEGDWFFTDLSVLASDISDSNAHAINDLGYVLVWAKLTSGEETKYLFKDGNMYDLNSTCRLDRDGRCGLAMRSTTKVGSSVDGYYIPQAKTRLRHGHSRGNLLLHIHRQCGEHQGQEHCVEGDDADRQRDDHGLERQVKL